MDSMTENYNQVFMYLWNERENSYAGFHGMTFEEYLLHSDIRDVNDLKEARTLHNNCNGDKSIFLSFVDFLEFKSEHNFDKGKANTILAKYLLSLYLNRCTVTSITISMKVILCNAWYEYVHNIAGIIISNHGVPSDESIKDILAVKCMTHGFPAPKWRKL